MNIKTGNKKVKVNGKKGQNFSNYNLIFLK